MLVNKQRSKLPLGAVAACLVRHSTKHVGVVQPSTHRASSCLGGLLVAARAVQLLMSLGAWLGGCPPRCSRATPKALLPCTLSCTKNHKPQGEETRHEPAPLDLHQEFKTCARQRRGEGLLDQTSSQSTETSPKQIQKEENTGRQGIDSKQNPGGH